MNLIDLWNAYWKEGLVYLILGAGVIQISPIKINPFSWIAKKIGNALNTDVITQLDENKKALNELDNKLDDYMKENERKWIDEARRRILAFNDKVVTNVDKISKERYDSVLEDIDKYEKYCHDHPDYPNSKAELSIKNLKSDYTNRYKS